MHQTQFSQKIPYGGFSQIRSHIVSSLVLQMQALKDVTAVVQSSESRVGKASKSIPPYKGTIVTHSLLRRQLKSW